MAPSGDDSVIQSHSSEGACVHLPQPFGRRSVFGTTESLLLILLQGVYIPYKHAYLKMQIAVLVIGVLEGQGVQRHAPAVHVSRDGRPIFGPSFKGQVVEALRHDIRDVLLPQVAIDGPLLRHGWSSSPGSHAPPSRGRRSDHQDSREVLFDLVRVSE